MASKPRPVRGRNIPGTVEHVTPLLHDFHWSKVLERIKFSLCVLTHRFLHGTAPPYLNYNGPPTCLHVVIFGLPQRRLWSSRQPRPYRLYPKYTPKTFTFFSSSEPNRRARPVGWIFAFNTSYDVVLHKGCLLWVRKYNYKI